MKILITGVSGLLGSEVYSRLTASGKHEVFGLSRRRPDFVARENHISADISDFQDVYSKITGINPDIVINTAAISNVDECERSGVVAYRINALGARNVAEAARRFDAYLIHISTDYVFGGATAPGKEGYREFDEPSPVNEYGKSKLWGEYFVSRSGAANSIIRTSWLFGPSGANFVATAASEGKVMAATDMTSSPTYSFDLVEALSRLAESAETGMRLTGIYHLTNSGCASRYDIAEFVAETLGLPKQRIQKVLRADLKLAATRPAFSAMDNFLWRAEGFRPLRPWQEAVKEYLINNQHIHGRG
ncbi:MAG: dTDP-4-dehydrorhamnose reductase [Endomicrobiia bacterium]|nr:dTDP-4-dehydrorhamnose reductase [Endomicrobiia bacterium]